MVNIYYLPVSVGEEIGEQISWAVLPRVSHKVAIRDDRGRSHLKAWLDWRCHFQFLGFQGVDGFWQESSVPHHVSLSTGCLRVPMTQPVAGFLQSKRSKRKQSHIQNVTHCHFRHFLVVRSQSESSSCSREGKLGSIFWSEVYQNTVWTCF